VKIYRFLEEHADNAVRAFKKKMMGEEVAPVLQHLPSFKQTSSFNQTMVHGTISSFSSDLSASCSIRPSNFFDMDSFEETNWIKNCGLSKSDKSLGGRLSDSTTKLIHLWIFHLDKKIKCIENCKTTPVVLSSRSKWRMNFKPKTDECRALAQLLDEAKTIFGYNSSNESEVSKNVNCSKIFTRVRRL